MPFSTGKKVMIFTDRLHCCLQAFRRKPAAARCPSRQMAPARHRQALRASSGPPPPRQPPKVRAWCCSDARVTATRSFQLAFANAGSASCRIERQRRSCTPPVHYTLAPLFACSRQATGSCQGGSCAAGPQARLRPEAGVLPSRPGRRCCNVPTHPRAASPNTIPLAVGPGTRACFLLINWDDRLIFVFVSESALITSL